MCLPTVDLDWNQISPKKGDNALGVMRDKYDIVDVVMTSVHRYTYPICIQHDIHYGDGTSSLINRNDENMLADLTI